MIVDPKFNRDFSTELFMRFSPWLLRTTLFIEIGLVLGCGNDASVGMKNMQVGTGPPIQKDLPLKKGKKPMPPDPPSPKAPPLPR
jgi:hypothetical protein